MSRHVALVTGGSRGIGRACALALARDGYDLAIIFAGNEAAAAECVGLLENEGATAKAYRCNVADEDEVNATVKQVQADFGSVWALVNDAGITRDTLLARMKDEDFDAVLDVNLKGAFHMIRALMRGFVRQKGGRIVNLASVVGLSGNIGQANYAASKAGLIGLTKSVARELAGRGVTCNAVAPGFIETDMTRALDEKTRAGYEGEIPLKRLGTAEEVANVVAFLASDKASYVTGETIRIDGGLCM
ncbi:MAG: 3-oxoacyl-[acyl-carrier-protein] reductase [Atopobiaceae bacterium]